MSNKDQQRIEFYTVYYARYDGAMPQEDLFFELRKDFFQNGQRLKNKVVRRDDGVDYRYSYVLENGSPMKWKKLAGYKLLEKSFSEADGTYQIVTQDSQKQVVKAAFFDFDHRWKRTEYFSPDVKKIPTAILMPSRDGKAITVKEYTPRQGEESGYELYPCEIPEDREELSLLNGATGIPEVIGRTDRGVVTFCRRQEVERRKTVLEAIRSGNQAKPLFTPERRPEEADPQTDRVGGFQVEQVAAEPSVDVTLPISPELLLTENVGKRVEQLKSEVEAALSRYENEDSYQWGTLSGELEKYATEEPAAEKPEQAQTVQPVEEKRPEEDGAADSISIEDSAEQEQLPQNPLPQAEPSEAEQKEQAYSYDRLIPDDRSITPDEKRKFRRYNVLVKPMSQDTYVGTIPSAGSVQGESYEGIQETLITDRGNEDEFLLSGCNGVENGCPYASLGKIRIDISENESYYYYGNVEDGLREGRGRTAMQNGCTAYEGSYKKDKRDGFGTYYYKTGRLCYAGNWKQNKRHGSGVQFRPQDGTVHVGRWEEDAPVGMGSRFDGEGNLLYAGKWENGKRQGAGVTYHAQDGRIFVGQWKDDVLSGKGTEFDGQGNLMYTGGWKDCKRNGFGTEYHESGEAVYSGGWKDNRYDGEGILHLEDGRTVQGEFADGQVCGQAAEYDAHGFKKYEGSWKNGRYHGEGCKYFQNGGRYQGTFQNGEPHGYLKGYDSQGQLVYNGEWENDQFNGEGSYYFQGEKIYEGGFRNNCYHGHGYQYQNGGYVFSGQFENNVRSGYGCSYRDGKLRYSGMWKADRADGAGILYEDGQARYAGEFRNGKPHGRVNTIAEGKVSEEGVYENGAMTYVKRYDPESGILLFEGNIQDGKPNGMGCFFTPFGEKREEGIFVDGVLRKSMKVSLRELPALPEQSALASTDYAQYSVAPVYAVEQGKNGGVYSGQLKDGIPNGKGTLLYQDHRYTGCFRDGAPYGKGILYRNDGTTLVGDFCTSRAPGTEHVQFEGGIAYHYLPMADENK